ncbi:MAG: hypothetical protein IPN19_07060 [Elusimicrobia bacterium]|nr:hypothetical protein [Elusimicrobiota bacterium]
MGQTDQRRDSVGDVGLGIQVSMDVQNVENESTGLPVFRQMDFSNSGVAQGHSGKIGAKRFPNPGGSETMLL